MPATHHVESSRDEAASLPQFAPFPPHEIIETFLSSEWNALLDAYSGLAGLYLRVPAETFARISGTKSSLSGFLQSYYASALSRHHTRSARSEKTLALDRAVFSLTHRAFTGKTIAAELLDWKFLGAFCHSYLKTKALAELLQKLWRDYASKIELCLRQARSRWTNDLETGRDLDAVQSDLRTLAPLLHGLPQAAAFMAEGSEFVDALAIGYSKAQQSLRDAIVPIAFLILASLVKSETLNRSALSDHLYSLKSQAESSGTNDTLLANLVTNTPILARLAGCSGEKGAERSRTLAASLQAFRTPAIARPRRVSRNKGKQPEARNNDQHIHLLSRITQVQDLFPDLGSGFVARLLDAFDDDIEAATSALLEDNLPSSLISLPRDLAFPINSSHPPDRDHADLIPQSMPPPQHQTTLPIRRNIHDNDALDLLTVPSTHLHTGHRNAPLSAPDTSHKASVLAALAAFDSDDDERDDTYDAADVGGTIDHAAPDGENSSDVRVSTAQHEDTLFALWRSDPGAFGRSAETRRSPARKQLRERTGWTDEALEGWAVVLGRDGARQRRLEARAVDARAGRGEEVQSTRWRREEEEEEEEGGDEEDSADGAGGERVVRGGRGRGRGGRGAGRGGRGRGAASAAGAPGPEGQVARQRKEAGKSSRANHSRRDQRARKVARAGYAG